MRNPPELHFSYLKRIRGAWYSGPLRLPAFPVLPAKIGMNQRLAE
jgi:hypothetical protein